MANNPEEDQICEIIPDGYDWGKLHGIANCCSHVFMGLG